MATLTRSLDDLILDGIVSKIAAHRDADKLVNAAYNYLVERDKTTPWQGLLAPLVNLEQDSDDPKNGDYSARYRALCLVPVVGADDATATARLYILKEQVKKALLDKANRDLGQAVGTLGTMTAPAWRRIKFDDDKLNEDVLVGEWSFEIPYSYEPLDLTLGRLETISATVAGMAALYQFDEEDA